MNEVPITEWLEVKIMEKVETWPGRNKYDWDLLFNGEIWKLSSGVDFTCTPRSMRYRAYMAARSRGMTARVTVENENVFIQRK